MPFFKQGETTLFQNKNDDYNNNNNETVDWNVEYVVKKTNCVICRAWNARKKTRRMFLLNKDDMLPSGTCHLEFDETNQSEQATTLSELPIRGSVFVEVNSQASTSTRWVVIKLYPAKNKVKARNDFNVAKTFDWPQENLKIISHVETTSLESEHKGGKTNTFYNVSFFYALTFSSDGFSATDNSVESALSNMNPDYRTLAKLISCSHQKRQVFVEIGSLSKIPLDVYIDKVCLYYINNLNGGKNIQSECVRKQIGRNTRQQLPKPPAVDIFCEFLASFTYLFDGMLPETEKVASYMMVNRDFISHLLRFVFLLIRHCMEELQIANMNEKDLFNNNIRNLINGFIIFNNLLNFEHHYHDNPEIDFTRSRCYVCEEWCFLQDVSFLNHCLLHLQNTFKWNGLRQWSSKIREAAVEFWTLCFADLYNSPEFFSNCVQVVLKKYKNRMDMLLVNFLQKILACDHFWIRLGSKENEQDILVTYFSNWLNEIAQKNSKSLRDDECYHSRLQLLYMASSRSEFLQRLTRKQENLSKFVNAQTHLIQVAFYLLFEYSNGLRVNDHAIVTDSEEASQSTAIYAIIFQFLSLLGIPRVGHSLFRYVLQSSFGNFRSLEKFASVIWKLMLVVSREQVAKEACHHFTLLNVLFQKYRQSLVEKRATDVMEDCDDNESMKNSWQLVDYQLEKTSDEMNSLTSAFQSVLTKLRKSITAIKPVEFSGLFKEQREFTKYAIEAELIRLKGDDSKPAPFIRIKRNEYTCDYIGSIRTRGEMDKVMICQCSAVAGLSCCFDSSCLNRASFTECHPQYCPGKNQCQNQRFYKCEYVAVKLFRAGDRGWGLKAAQFIPKGTFIMEYQGEVVDLDEYERRKRRYRGEQHFYFMSLDAGHMIDASRKSNMARFINHSCQPNCHTEKWNVIGEPCVGIFASKDIEPGTELVFDYNVDRKGAGEENVPCRCGAPNCRNWLTGGAENIKQEEISLVSVQRVQRIAFLENALSKLEYPIQPLSQHEIAINKKKRNQEESKEPDTSMKAIQTMIENTSQDMIIPKQVEEFHIPKKKPFKKPTSLPLKSRPESTPRQENDHEDKYLEVESPAIFQKQQKSSNITTTKDFGRCQHVSSKEEQHVIPKDHVTVSRHSCKEERSFHSDNELTKRQDEPPGFGYEYLRLVNNNRKQ
eukprot:jgi/Galph1/3634/GphlegSOOS_G2306.1